MMMFFGLFAAVIPLVILVGAAAVAWRVVQGGGVRRQLWIQGSNPELEARLARIEEAIDAMADQIERITEAERQRLASESPASSARASLAAHGGSGGVGPAPLPPEPGAHDHSG